MTAINIDEAIAGAQESHLDKLKNRCKSGRTASDAELDAEGKKLFELIGNYRWKLEEISEATEAATEFLAYQTETRNRFHNLWNSLKAYSASDFKYLAVVGIINSSQVNLPLPTAPLPKASDDVESLDKKITYFVSAFAVLCVTSALSLGDRSLATEISEHFLAQNHDVFGEGAYFLNPAEDAELTREQRRFRWFVDVTRAVVFCSFAPCGPIKPSKPNRSYYGSQDLGPEAMRAYALALEKYHRDMIVRETFCEKIIPLFDAFDADLSLVVTELKDGLAASDIFQALKSRRELTTRTRKV